MRKLLAVLLLVVMGAVQAQLPIPVVQFGDNPGTPGTGGGGSGGGGGTLPEGVIWQCEFTNDLCDFVVNSGRNDFVGPDYDTPHHTYGNGRDFATDPTDKAIKLSTDSDYCCRHSTPAGWVRYDIQRPVITSGTDSYCRQGKEEWWAFSLKYDSDYDPSPTEALGVDFHHYAPSGQANLEISVGWFSGVKSGMRMHAGASASLEQWRVAQEDPWNPGNYSYERNKWYDFVIHVYWSSGPDGFFEAWVNNKRFVAPAGSYTTSWNQTTKRYTGPTLYSFNPAGGGFPDSRVDGSIPCYLKLANYHDYHSTGVDTIWYDRVRIGTSLESVRHSDWTATWEP